MKLYIVTKNNFKRGNVLSCLAEGRSSFGGRKKINFLFFFFNRKILFLGFVFIPKRTRDWDKNINTFITFRHNCWFQGIFCLSLYFRNIFCYFCFLSAVNFFLLYEIFTIDFCTIIESLLSALQVIYLLYPVMNTIICA